MFRQELWYAVEKYPTRSSNSTENNIFSKGLTYEITVVQKIQFSRLELRTRLPFLKYILFGIWDWGLANSFWDHVIQISIRQMNFHYIFSQLWKVNSFVKTFTPKNQMLVSEELLCISNMDFYIWYRLGTSLQCII